MKLKTLRNISFSCLAVLIVMMMAATVLEKLHGTPFAFRWVYHNPVFIVLWAVTALTGMLYLLRCGAARKVFTFGLHLAFVLILAGALVTFLFGQSGSIHLREGEALSAFELDDGGSAALPFSIRLDEFAIDYHHGSMAPSDYR
nr:cytochrome c biogenesis protein ResB [Bacteroidales bacterium]